MTSQWFQQKSFNLSVIIGFCSTKKENLQNNLDYKKSHITLYIILFKITLPIVVPPMTIADVESRVTAQVLKIPVPWGSREFTRPQPSEV